MDRIKCGIHKSQYFRIIMPFTVIWYEWHWQHWYEWIHHSLAQHFVTYPLCTDRRIYSMVCSTVYTPTLTLGMNLNILCWKDNGLNWVNSLKQCIGELHSLWIYHCRFGIFAVWNLCKNGFCQFIACNCLTEIENNLLIYYVDYGHNLEFNIAAQIETTQFKCVWTVEKCNLVS